jgi:hypothetical protein
MSSRSSLTVFVSVYVAVLTVILSSAGFATWLFQVPYQQALLVMLGAFLIGSTYAKPWWFWDYYEAYVLRSLVGDRLAVMIYSGLGIALLGLGLLVDIAP